MRVLVTGAGGMLGRAAVRELRGRHHQVVAVDRRELDVTDAAAVCARIMQEAPDVVLQCAAYTAVDAAEGEEEEAFRVNAEATRRLAEICRESGALFVYPSTDYVFSGTSDRPYRCDDPTGPVNAYGRTKLAGEEAARKAARYLIVRTSWLYGEGGRNFVDTIVQRAQAGHRLEVVDDQWGRPTWTGSLSVALGDLLDCGAEGVFHVTDGGGVVSWYGIAREIVKLKGLATDVLPVSTREAARPARRAAYSVLDCSRTEEVIGRSLPDWRESLGSFLETQAKAASGAVVAKHG